MPSPFLVEGPSVLVPARVAALLERELKLDALRVRVRGRDRELDLILLAWHAVSAQWLGEQRDQACFRSGGNVFGELRKQPDHWSTEEVAALADCRTRTVTAAATAGRLVGEQVAGRWQFRPEDVAHWRATRKRGAAA